MSAPAGATLAAEPKHIHAPSPSPPGWVPAGSPGGDGAPFAPKSEPAHAEPESAPKAASPPWPADLVKPPGCKFSAGNGWRICAGRKFLCSSPDPYLLVETWNAIEAGTASAEPPWPSDRQRPTGLSWLTGVWRVRRHMKTIAFSREPDILIERLRAAGEPIIIAARIPRPSWPPATRYPRGTTWRASDRRWVCVRGGKTVATGGTPSELIAAVVAAGASVDGRFPGNAAPQRRPLSDVDRLRIFTAPDDEPFRRASEPAISLEQVAARLSVHSVAVAEAAKSGLIPKHGRMFLWSAVKKALKAAARRNEAPGWFNDDDLVD